MVISVKNRVFVNRTLNLKQITYLGLDMDHTLVRYQSQQFEKLAHEIILSKLVEELGYPEKIKAIKFDYNSAIRGLIIDKAKGNVLKLSRYAAIRSSRHGLKNLDFKTQQKTYKSKYIDVGQEEFDSVDTTFSISFASLFMNLVDLMDEGELPKVKNYHVLANDILSMLDKSHRDDSLKAVVRKNLEKYIIKDVELIRSLERYRQHGKKLFIVTNSDFQYTKTLLDFTVNPFLKRYKHWRELFEFVITSAQKPKFFYQQEDYIRINPKTGEETPFDSKLLPGVYKGGNADQLTRDLGLFPDEILYVGDHIYGDIVRLKIDCSWRTALVIEEIEQEVKSFQSSAEISQKIEGLMAEKIPLEVEYNDKIAKRIELGKKKQDKNLEELRKKIAILDNKISPLIKKQQKNFNPFWGEIMRVGIEESYFASQVERFACIYMAKLQDFLSYSPRSYFRAHKRTLPHEVDLS
jgi:HAD superfamily 5'-nucleotidase-like hydrolase